MAFGAAIASLSQEELDAQAEQLAAEDAASKPVDNPYSDQGPMGDYNAQQAAAAPPPAEAPVEAPPPVVDPATSAEASRATGYDVPPPATGGTTIVDSYADMGNAPQPIPQGSTEQVPPPNAGAPPASTNRTIYDSYADMGNAPQPIPQGSTTQVPPPNAGAPPQSRTIYDSWSDMGTLQPRSESTSGPKVYEGYGDIGGPQPLAQTEAVPTPISPPPPPPTPYTPSYLSGTPLAQEPAARPGGEMMRPGAVPGTEDRSAQTDWSNMTDDFVAPPHPADDQHQFGPPPRKGSIDELAQTVQQQGVGGAIGQLLGLPGVGDLQTMVEAGPQPGSIGARLGDPSGTAGDIQSFDWGDVGDAVQAGADDFGNYVHSPQFATDIALGYGLGGGVHTPGIPKWATIGEGAPKGGVVTVPREIPRETARPEAPPNESLPGLPPTDLVLPRRGSGEAPIGGYNELDFAAQAAAKSRKVPTRSAKPGETAPTEAPTGGANIESPGGEYRWVEPGTKAGGAEGTWVKKTGSPGIEARPTTDPLGKTLRSVGNDFVADTLAGEEPGLIKRRTANKGSSRVTPDSTTRPGEGAATETGAPRGEAVQQKTLGEGFGGEVRPDSVSRPGEGLAKANGAKPAAARKGATPAEVFVADVISGEAPRPGEGVAGETGAARGGEIRSKTYDDWIAERAARAEARKPAPGEGTGEPTEPAARGKVSRKTSGKTTEAPVATETAPRPGEGRSTTKAGAQGKTRGKVTPAEEFVGEVLSGEAPRPGEGAAAETGAPRGGEVRVKTRGDVEYPTWERIEKPYEATWPEAQPTTAKGAAERAQARPVEGPPIPEDLTTKTATPTTGGGFVDSILKAGGTKPPGKGLVGKKVLGKTINRGQVIGGVVGGVGLTTLGLMANSENANVPPPNTTESAPATPGGLARGRTEHALGVPDSGTWVNVPGIDGSRVIYDPVSKQAYGYRDEYNVTQPIPDDWTEQQFLDELARVSAIRATGPAGDELGGRSYTVPDVAAPDETVDTVTTGGTDNGSTGPESVLSGATGGGGTEGETMALNADGSITLPDGSTATGPSEWVDYGSGGGGGSSYRRSGGGYSGGGGGYSRRGKKKKGSGSFGGGGGMWPGFPFNRPASPIRQHVLDAIALSMAKGRER